jgi:hypothetical protein
MYALLEGACQLLEISRDDVDGTLHQAGAGVTTIVLFDVVPGGAGHVGRIAHDLHAVLVEALRKVQNCECGKETSCYRCLRVFRNERFHEELSRGAAGDLLGRLLGIRPDAVTLSRYAASKLSATGVPGERMLLTEAPFEVFQRVQPGQVDLYAGRLCLVDTPSGRLLGTFEFSEGTERFALRTADGHVVAGPVVDLRLVAAAV